MCGLYRAMMEREEKPPMKMLGFPCSAGQPFKGGLWDSWAGLDDEDPILLSGWSEYYNLRSLPLSSPVADGLSHPLMVYYMLTAFSISSKNLLFKGKEVIPHYLGPEGEMDWMPTFVKISHLLGKIQVAMVGPEFVRNKSGISSRVRVNLVRGVHQEEATNLPSPHVIAALNCVLDRHASWGGALDLIKAMGIPAFFNEPSEICVQMLNRFYVVLDCTSPTP
ncbi:zinc finger MYND domain-containing protein 15-like [Durio zibethinus]|uniref:Zinc finger MYND domain-containing protein 15-like n=1 Tax=Durio zibethinus TaxID=66656 RepID=A0A6P5WY79_DURZI|nr:zinc finger MYND domain-containing protein 15-like [Durio zibethinus]